MPGGACYGHIRKGGMYLANGGEETVNGIRQGEGQNKKQGSA